MGSVQGLDQVGGIAQEHGVAGGANNHADHREPDVSWCIRSLSTIPNTQHVTHGHEKGIGVLDVPSGILTEKDTLIVRKFEAKLRVFTQFGCDVTRCDPKKTEPSSPHRSYVAFYSSGFAADLQLCVQRGNCWHCLDSFTYLWVGKNTTIQ